MTIHRRKFLSGAAVGGAAAAAAAASSFPKPAIAQDRVELTMVTTWPKNFPGLGTGAQRLADQITATTEGRVTVTLYAAGELVGAFESFDAVASGNADCFHGASYYWQGKSQAFNFFCAIPMGMTANEMDAWLYFGGGLDLWHELGEQFGVISFPAGNTGSQMGGWFRQEVNSPDDFNGLKFRMPGLGGEVLRRLGAAVVALPGGEIFPALQAGTIDATEWVGPWNDLAFGFYQVASFYYWPGFHEPGSVLEFTLNRSVWEGLSETDQEIIRACCASENNKMLAEFNHNNPASLQTLINEHNVELREFSPEIYEAFNQASFEVLEETGAGDDITSRVYESFMAARARAKEWTRISDQGYANVRG